MTETIAQTPLGWVMYDGECGFCVNLMRRFQPLLHRRGFQLIPLQSAWARERLQITMDEPLTEMKLLMADGHASGGADAIVEIARLVWWARPLVLLTSVPGVMTLVHKLYRHVAAKRHCAARWSLTQGSAAFTPLHSTTGSTDNAISNAKSFCNFKRHKSPALRFGAWDFSGVWSLKFGVSLSAWLPLILLPAFAVMVRSILPAWVFMWLMASAIFFGYKWLTWRRACRSGCHPSVARSLGYLFAWPGMDAMAFCASGGARTFLSAASPERSAALTVSMPTSLSYAAADRNVRAPCRTAASACSHTFGAWNLKLPWSLPALRSAFDEGGKFEVWSFAVVQTLAGALLIRMAARGAFATSPLVNGWLGMIGLVMFLHFGLFHFLSLAWHANGVNAQPIMRAPLLATSLAQFWGRRWNMAFHALAHDLVFRPLVRRWGATVAGIGVFLISGLIHETVISLPARGGFGLPTAYFAAQSLGVLTERSPWGRRLGLGRGFRGWLFVVLCAGAPAFWLFHPVFIRNVILPMLHAIGAN